MSVGLHRKAAAAQMSQALGSCWSWADCKRSLFQFSNGHDIYANVKDVWATTGEDLWRGWRADLAWPPLQSSSASSARSVFGSSPVVPPLNLPPRTRPALSSRCLTVCPGWLLCWVSSQGHCAPQPVHREHGEPGQQQDPAGRQLSVSPGILPCGCGSRVPRDGEHVPGLSGAGVVGVNQLEHTGRKVLQMAPEPDLHLVTNM